MGSMMVRALLGADRPVEEDVWASNRSREKLEDLSFRYARLKTGENRDLARECRTLFLCMRPADTKEALAEIREDLTAEHLLVLITNVVELERLAEVVPCRTAKMIPSFAQFVRKGVSLLVPGPRATGEDMERLRDLAERVSRVYEIHEHQSRAATNVVSCGPGFLARFCTAWAEAAHEMQPDIPLEDWEYLVWETVRGAAELPRAGVDGREILEDVSTPGGMTYAGLQVMDRVLPAMWAEVMRRTAEHERALRAEIEL